MIREDENEFHNQPFHYRFLLPPRLPSDRLYEKGEFLSLAKRG
jgi:hypothetical protein